MTGRRATRGHAMGACERALVEAYDTAMFDLDGVIYIAGEAVADAPRHVARAVAAGMTAAFVTNNASRPPEAVAERLRRLGVACGPEDVVTSAQAAARLVASMVPAGAPVLLVGGEGLEHALAEQGLVAVSTLDDGPSAVVQGFHPDVGWRLLAEGCAAVATGMPWVAANTDMTVPSPRGPAPGNGLLVDVIARTTGRRPVVAGKPEPPLFEETVLRVGGRRPLVVGDRLDTDIEGAVRCDADALLVMTGVTDVVTLTAAPAGGRPTYVADDMAGLFTPHPAPQRCGEAFTCGGWSADVDPSGGSDDADAAEPRLRGRGRVDDALRALAGLCWARSDEGRPPFAAERVVSAWRSVVGER